MKKFRIAGTRLRKGNKKDRKKCNNGAKKCKSEGRKSVMRFKKTDRKIVTNVRMQDRKDGRIAGKICRAVVRTDRKTVINVKMQGRIDGRTDGRTEDRISGKAVISARKIVKGVKTPGRTDARTVGRMLGEAVRKIQAGKEADKAEDSKTWTVEVRGAGHKEWNSKEGVTGVKMIVVVDGVEGVGNPLFSLQSSFSLLSLVNDQ
jgi:hypothetical protein